MAVSSIQQKTKALGELAEVFEYPYAEYRNLVSEWISSHATEFGAASAALSEFNTSISELSNDQLEEIYTRTFDMAPVCSPYISGHLYGDENFERGNLLTALSERYASAKFDLRGELPDHISLLLRFSPQMEQEEFDELVEFCLEKPLEDMEANLYDNPYRHVVHAVREVLHSPVEVSAK